MDYSEVLNSLSGVEFENLCASILSKMGLQVETTKTSGDGGIDIIVTTSSAIFGGKYIIQCKRYTGNVGEPILRDLYGVVMSERANKGILMTTGHFTQAAVKFCIDKPLELIDIDKLVELIVKNGVVPSVNYESIDKDELYDILEKGMQEFDFWELLENYESAPSDIIFVGKLFYKLFTCATDSIWNSDLTLNDRCTLLKACVHYTRSLMKYDLNAIKDKSHSMRIFILIWLRAQAAFLSGQYKEAEKCYLKLIDFDDLVASYNKDNGLLETFYRIIVDTITFYSIIGKTTTANKIISHPVFKKIIDIKKELIANSIVDTNNHQITMTYKKWLNNIENMISTPTFYLIKVNDQNLFNKEYKFYDKIQKKFTHDTLYLPEEYNTKISDGLCLITDYSGELLIKLDI